MKTKFLWIEDNARIDLRHMLAPVYMSGKYDPIVAKTVAEGIYQLRHTEFKAVIIDIRLPPGNDDDWQNLYLRLGASKGTARLGLYLLYSLFDPRLDDVKIADKPAWIKRNPQRFGVLTVEDLGGDVGEALKSFGIGVREQKTAQTPGTILLRMVERILGAAG